VCARGDARLLDVVVVHEKGHGLTFDSFLPFSRTFSENQKSLRLGSM
jgi:uncharacterized caspase-like protein